MKAGTELDTLIAEKVMGWHEIETVVTFGLSSIEGIPPDYDKYEIAVARKSRVPIPRYTTDIAASWKVIEHLKKHRNIFFCIEQHHLAHEITVWLFDADNVPEGIIVAEDIAKYSASSCQLPHAICLAALKAVGADLRR